jgi:subtilisin-like proprotein convertase family protein
MKIKISLLLLILITSLQILGQTRKQRNVITDSYDLKKLSKLAQKYATEAKEQKNKALEKALKEGWKIKGEENGRFFELMRLTPDGKPIYYQTENYYAAKTIQADKLYNGGSLGINIQGQNMIVGLWDGGAVRSTHNLLNGRVIQRDGATFSSPTEGNRHATHVTGTMIANGLTRYRGVAFNATAWTHDWNNDDAEMVNEAAQGLLASNHSYGMQTFDYFGNCLIDIYWFGKYSTDARNWDEIMYNAPYYLIVDAAGNDRYWAANGPNKGGYDMLTGNSTGKNGITVAAVRRVSYYNGPSSVIMSNFSNWGPTDDGRIKPDISSQGVDVSSCTSDSDSSTASYDGTSMAAPSVTAGVILLQQYYNQVYGNYLKSATVKGLALHTANEAGNYDGPDYKYGWGLMNLEKAALTIKENGLKSLIEEISLSEGETYTFTVNADGSVPLMASICWTDPAGEIITGSSSFMLDNPTPALVNDLDIRITKNGTTFYPWKLNPANPGAAAFKGDNTVDNFEKIQVDNPSGTYTIEISHKGNLKYGKQDVSIIVTGINNSIAINTTNGNKKSVCSDSNDAVTYNLLYTKQTGVTGTTDFSINGLPNGANATFTPSSMTTEGNFTLEISGLSNVDAGIYNLDVSATNNGNTVHKNLILHVLKDNFTEQYLTSPIDGAGNLRLPFSLEWERHPNAESYNIQIAVNDTFSNIIIDETVENNTFSIKDGTYGISYGNTYYWRVKPINQCADGNFSTEYRFTVLDINCSQDFNMTAVNIPSVANNNPITSTITSTETMNISRMRVYVNISHTKISDLEIKLTGPNNDEVILNQSGTCNGDFQNIEVTYDDYSNNFVDCNDTPPAISGDVKPFELLSTFNGVNTQGDWILSISDPVADNGGSLNLWAIDFCEEILNNTTDDLLDFKVWPNPSNGQINIELTGKNNINVRLIDTTGREVYNKQFDNQNKLFKRHLLLGYLNKGVYLLQITDGDKITTKRIIIN